jgi:hypothetical protein
MNVGGDGAEDDVMMDINTTPLIDVMLVLLVMFIITIPIQLHGEPRRVALVHRLGHCVRHGKKRTGGPEEATRSGGDSGSHHSAASTATAQGNQTA